MGITAVAEDDIPGDESPNAFCNGFHGPYLLLRAPPRRDPVNCLIGDS
jgi:hypothetical protein